MIELKDGVLKGLKMLKNVKLLYIFPGTKGSIQYQAFKTSRSTSIIILNICIEITPEFFNLCIPTVYIRCDLNNCLIVLL